MSVRLVGLNAQSLTWEPLVNLSVLPLRGFSEEPDTLSKNALLQRTEEETICILGEKCKRLSSRP